MIVHPNAKINLGLNILAKRSDGFHEIESCFLPIGLSDRIEIESVKGSTKIELSGIDIPGVSSENLCIKAWEKLHTDYQIPSVSIRLKKMIPIGSGLGGGSSDAAFILRALNSYFQLDISNEKLTRYAAQLGSDCAFFVNNIPAIARGRGEKLTPFAMDLEQYKLVLIYPGVHVSTAQAYASVYPCAPEECIEDILSDAPEYWQGRLINDFETSVFKTFPLIGEIKKHLYEKGAVYASMSGSGSSVYGFFKNKIPVKILEQFKKFFIWYTI
jgi:4-diphosphocytidyl-2-C-methyl-D-erythritol kinase